MELQESITDPEKPLSKSSYEDIKTLIKNTVKSSQKEQTNIKQVFKRSPLKKSFSLHTLAYLKPSGDKSPI